MIVVTGATGFIGSAIVWELNQAGLTDILCVDTAPPATRPKILDNKKYDSFMTEKDFISKLEANEIKDIQWVIHMGACSSTTEMNREFLRENNTLYTERIFKWCTTNKVKFVYASSGAVYGDGTKGFDDQTAAEEFTPLNPYGESKLNFDIWALKQKNTPPLWMGLRFFNVYGPNEYYKKDMSSVVFKAFRQINVNGNLKLFRSHNTNYEDGKQLRDFVYVKDITAWILQIINGKGFSGIYNMGFGKARPWLDLASSVFKNLEQDMNIEWTDIPESIRERYQYHTCAKMERFLSMGFQRPQWSLEEGVTDYVTHYLKKDDPFM